MCNLKNILIHYAILLIALNAQSFGNTLQNTLIESAILLNLKSLKEASTKRTESNQRRFSTTYEELDPSTSGQSDFEILIGDFIDNIDIQPSYSSNLDPLTKNPDQNDKIDLVGDNENFNFDGSISEFGLEGDLILLLLEEDDPIQAIDYAIDYMTLNKVSLSLTDDELAVGIKTVFSAYFATFSVEPEGTPEEIEKQREEQENAIESGIGEIPRIAMENFLQKKDTDFTKWGWILSKALMETLIEKDLDTPENLELLSNSFTNSALSIMESFPDNDLLATNFDLGVVSPEDPEYDDKMKFDSSDEFPKFNPEKSRVFENISKGLADGFFKHPNFSELVSDNEDVESGLNLSDYFSMELGDDDNPMHAIAKGAISGVTDYFVETPGDNSAFLVEVNKAVSFGLTAGVISSTNGIQNYIEQGLPQLATEKISQLIAYESIEQTLQSMENTEAAETYSDSAKNILTKIAESAAYGSARGSQVASILGNIWDHLDTFEEYKRQEIAKAVSKGSTKGAVSAANESSPISLSGIETNPDLQDEYDESLENILNVSQSAAMGSLFGNTAMAVYFPVEDIQSIINLSAQGATGGAIGSSNIPEKLPNVTENVEVDIVRASSQGAAMGAIFATNSLLEARPDLVRSDEVTLSTIEAVTYGATYGSIETGIGEMVGEEALILKQASMQGVTEGSKIGINLALGKGIEDDLMSEADTLKSIANIQTAITTTNDQAAKNANSSVATKTIRTSSNDMLLLMRKFNINPRFTNPTKIFKGTVTKKFGEDFPVDSNVSYASPI